MATLVLSTVGTAIAGPIGGMLGSLVGQSIDQQLFGGGPRRGPRLGDLSVQGSSYGTAIPRIYGTMRVAGTIVWATDIKESSELQGDGKSQPETVVYTYSASFAVALSSRQAGQVGRIWADGTLVRGAAGDMKFGGKFRFYPGSEAQPVDPLIAAAEGPGGSPAYRGLALAVFEDLPLGSFGNRIPTLTFELIADSANGPGLGQILGDASGGTIACDDERAIGGYAAYGGDIGAAVSPLVDAFALELSDDGLVLRSAANGEVIEAIAQQLGASADDKATTLFDREQESAVTLPGSVTLTYYDGSRDFQSSQARVSAASASRSARSVALPCVMPAGAAKALAEDMLLRAWALRDRVAVRLGPEFMLLGPGGRLRAAGLAGQWVVEHVEIERFVVTALLRPEWSRTASRSADAGRPLPGQDVVAAQTRLALLDLPEPATGQPTLFLAAASPSNSWRPVPIEVEVGGVISTDRSALAEAVLGSALTPLAAGQSALVDELNRIDVQLANPDHWLQSRDDAALAMGANLAAVGDEVIQFGSAEAIGPGRFRLSRLLRGRGGTEWAIAAHGAGEDFVLLDGRSLKTLSLPVELLGMPVRVTAHGPGDQPDPPAATMTAEGEAMRPLAPANLRAIPTADGTVRLSWVRRSRLAWGWVDEIEAPADNEFHGFRVTVAGPSGSITADVQTSEYVLSAAERVSLGAGQLTVDIRQIGVAALSRPATITINA